MKKLTFPGLTPKIYLNLDLNLNKSYQLYLVLKFIKLMSEYKLVNTNIIHFFTFVILIAQNI